MSEVKLFVGVDLASVAEHQVYVTDALGDKLGERSVGHSGKELERFFDWLLELEGEPSAIVLGVEAPGNTLVCGALNRGLRVYHANPKKIDRFRERESVAGAKSDRRDARVVAHALRTDLRCFQQVKESDPNVIALQEIVRERSTLVEQLGVLSNRLRDQLMRYYPAALELCPAANERWFWRVIELALTPQEAKRIRPARIAKVLKECRIRKVDARTVVDKLREKPPFVQTKVVTACSSRVRRLIKQLSPLSDLVAEVETELNATLSSFTHDATDSDPHDSCQGRHRDAAILLSMPGVGTIVGATVLAEASEAIAIRDYQRFRLIAGIAPVTKHSGKRKKRSCASMRYACSKQLRTALHHMARVAAKHDEAAKAHYRRLRDNGATYGRALRGVADRLARIMFAALRTGTLYDPSRLRGPYSRVSEASAVA